MLAIQTIRSSREVVVLERDGRFYVYQPDLAILASDENIERAYNKFSDARNIFLAEVERTGLNLGQVPADVSHSAKTRNAVGPRGIAVELGVFAVKVCLVLILIGALGVVTAAEIGRSIKGASQAVAQKLAPLGAISMSDAVTKAEDVARDLRDLPDARKESLRTSLSAISRELTPFIEAWRNPAPTTSPGR